MAEPTDAAPSRRPRGPKKVARAVREVEILREAGVVFASRGFHATSMDEIAERAGVSKPLVYNYFGSKESLYFAYVERSGGDLLGAIVTIGREASTDPEERLRAGALAFFAFVEERRQGWDVLYSELAAAGAPFRREVLEVRRRIVVATAALFEEVAGEGDGDDYTALAHAFVGAGESLANWWLQHPDESKEAMAERLMNVTWEGLRAILTR